MSIHVYWNHAPTVAGDDGIAWVGVSGPSGSVALSGGGYGSSEGSPYASQPADAAYPIVVTKPDQTDDRSWLLGFAAARGTTVVGHVFVIVEETP